MNINQMNIVDMDIVDTKEVSTPKKSLLDQAGSDEWPIYSHPQGGWVKFTPWGSVRMTVNEQGEIVNKFEDVSFHDTSFDMPSTPVLEKSPVPNKEEVGYGQYGVEQENYFGM